MNVKNNKRRRESVEKIEKAFIELLQTKALHTVTVSDICKLSGLNRSTFYANFLDIYNLADKIKLHLEEDFGLLFDKKTAETATTKSSGFVDSIKMFQHIKENQLFYKTYFKLGYDNSHQVLLYNVKDAEKYFDNKHISYHIEFFRNGLNAVIKKWLEDGCAESPEEMAEIISSEYQGRK